MFTNSLDTSLSGDHLLLGWSSVDSGVVSLYASIIRFDCTGIACRLLFPLLVLFF